MSLGKPPSLDRTIFVTRAVSVRVQTKPEHVHNKQIYPVAWISISATHGFHTLGFSH